MPLFGKKREPEDTAPALELPQADRFLPGDVPRGYRATRTVSGTAPNGTRVFRSGAGVSLLSQAEAEARAAENAQRALQAALAGSAGELDAYAYSVDRQLEPVVETLRGPAGEAIARITFNSYAALVMNANAMLFADIDGSGGTGRLDAVVREQPDLAFRVYRTPAGARYVCTSRTFDPRSAETADLLERLGSDPKYTLLCRIQRCFRARLTPKPWRAGKRPDAIIASPANGISRGELERFLGSMAGYAAARFERVVGAGSETLPEIASLVAYHDRWCRATSDRPLA
jgi:hypothetical protein